ncbi:MAG: hypothetical protein FJ395_18435 [Verrucomicrobia bacterium]|nr:hypothetical protein [Verrucomicrobiota bacterium]
MKTTCCLIGLLSVSAWAGLSIKVDETTQQYTIEDNGQPVLTYNFGTVSAPAGVTGKYAVARSNYIHPLYGPNGEVLTADYPKDHPHHRGIYWAWPEVTYRGEMHDLHALQGVFARPVKMLRQKGGIIEAENVWKWGDTEPIVRERATIRVSPGRVVDLEFRLTAINEPVTIARRKQNMYGGLNLRFSERQEQVIVTNQSWGVISGVPPEGKGPVSVAIFQHPGNNTSEWAEYPKLNWLQPLFPAKDTVATLTKDKPLVLKYRLWIFTGAPDEKELTRRSREYK